jgi:hypothetical protein
MARDADTGIDRLYQLPLAEFTAARKALAATLDRKAAAEVRALQKPTLPAWAVNQLYWRERATYDRLVEAAQRLRATHGAAVSGKGGNLRAASEAHREAASGALKRTLALLEESGERPTAAVRTAIGRTLEALPAGSPGRLVRPLQPGGFEALAGLAPSGELSRRSPRSAGKVVRFPDKGDAARQRQAQAAARRRLAAAKTAVRRAEQEVRRAEATLDRLRKDEEQARERWDRAREQIVDAERLLDRLRRTRDEAIAAAMRAEAEGD